MGASSEETNDREKLKRKHADGEEKDEIKVYLPDFVSIGAVVL